MTRILVGCFLLLVACGEENERATATAVAPISIVENTTASFELTGTGQGELVAKVISEPEHGSLDRTIGPAPLSVTYTPEADFIGSDAVRFTIKGEKGPESLSQTVEITVTKFNEPPTADGQVVSTAVDTPLVITLTGEDPEGTDLVFTIVDQADHGSLGELNPVGQAATVTYTPEAGYTGTDSLGFTVGDGEKTSDPAVVVIQIP